MIDNTSAPPGQLKGEFCIMSEQEQFEETCGCGHHHREDEGCGCEHHHEDGEGCGCEHHHEDGEGCGCGHHHEEGEGCGCGHHHHGDQQAQAAPYVVQGQMLGTSAVATATVTVMAKYADTEALAKKELQGLADWVIGENGAIIQMKSALVAIHSTMIAMTEDGKSMDSVVPEKEEIRVQFVAMADNISLDAIKVQLEKICGRIIAAAQ